MTTALSDQYDQPVRIEWKLVAALRTEYPTITLAELAKRVGVNLGTVHRWVHDLRYQRYESWVLAQNFDAIPQELKEPVLRAALDVAEEFEAHSAEMQDRLHRIIEMTNDPKLEAELCQDWLDRAGFAPQRKVAQGGRTTVLTAEAMEVFFKRASEAGLIPAQLTEATGERSDAPGHSESSVIDV